MTSPPEGLLIPPITSLESLNHTDFYGLRIRDIGLASGIMALVSQRQTDSSAPAFASRAMCTLRRWGPVVCAVSQGIVTGS
jgi:hypothetical protein